MLVGKITCCGRWANPAGTERNFHVESTSTTRIPRGNSVPCLLGTCQTLAYPWALGYYRKTVSDQRRRSLLFPASMRCPPYVELCWTRLWPHHNVKMLRLHGLRLWWPVLCWCWHGSSLGWWKSSPWANELPHTMWGRSMDKLSSTLHHWGDSPVVITHLNNQLGSHAENSKWSGFPVGALTRTMTWIYAKFTLSQRGPSVSGGLKTPCTGKPGKPRSQGR